MWNLNNETNVCNKTSINRDSQIELVVTIREREAARQGYGIKAGKQQTCGTARENKANVSQ